MELGALLIPGIGGFLFFSTWRKTRVQIPYLSTAELVFKAALIGIVLLVVAHVLVEIAICVKHHCRPLNLFWALEGLPDNGTFLSFGGSVLLGWIAAWVLNFFVSKDEVAAQIKEARTRGNQIALLIHDSMQTRNLIEVTLSSRKVYVGFPIEFELNADEGDLALVPVFSGFRNPDDQELKLKAFYGEVHAQLYNSTTNMEDWHPDEFRLIVPMREIVSLRTFNSEFYDRATGLGQSIRSSATD